MARGLGDDEFGSAGAHRGPDMELEKMGPHAVAGLCGLIPIDRLRKKIIEINKLRVS